MDGQMVRPTLSSARSRVVTPAATTSTLQGRVGLCGGMLTYYGYGRPAYGAIVIMPKQGVPYPFAQPHEETVPVLGEWWNSAVEEVVTQGNALGLPPNMSDAHTINGKPGSLFLCSDKHTFVETYLRIINAALNDELFFAIAGHSMTVVEIDAVYCKPSTTNALLIAPGQTMNVTTRQGQPSPRKILHDRQLFHGCPDSSGQQDCDSHLQYEGIPKTVVPVFPKLPASNDSAFADNYLDMLRSLNTPQFPQLPAIPTGLVVLII